MILIIDFGCSQMNIGSKVENITITMTITLRGSVSTSFQGSPRVRIYAMKYEEEINRKNKLKRFQKKRQSDLR